MQCFFSISSCLLSVFVAAAASLCLRSASSASSASSLCSELLKLRCMLLLFITVILGYVASRFAFPLQLLLFTRLHYVLRSSLSTLPTRSSSAIVLGCERLKRFFFLDAVCIRKLSTHKSNCRLLVM